MKKINVSSIFRDHVKTLVNNNTNRPGFEDWFLFLIIPILIAITLVVTFHTIDKDVANTIITILSIFVGLLINVIVLLFDIVRRDEEQKSIKNEVLRETLTNISYTILVGIIGILITLLTFMNYKYVRVIFSACSYFVLAHIFMTLLMIMKRIYALFNDEIQPKKPSARKPPIS